MATLFDEIKTLVVGQRADMEVLKGHCEQLQKRLHTVEGRDEIRKVMTGAGPVRKANARLWGGDGASTYDPSRTGEFYREVAYLGDPRGSGLNLGDHTTVVKSLNRRGSVHITQKTALAEGTGNLGGYLVPPEYKLDLYRAIGEKSFLRDKVRTQPMAYREFNYPALNQGFTPSAGQSAYYGGMIWSWEPEGANYNTLAQTNPTFRNIKLVARDLVGITVSSNQLLQDSPIVIGTVLDGLIQDSTAWSYDYYMLRGNGAAQPQGMLGAACALTSNTGSAGHFTMAGAATMLSKFLPAGWGNGCWLAHPSTIPDFIGMTNKTEAPGVSSGFLIWLNQLEGAMQNKIPALFMGLPLVFTEKLPAAGSGSVGSVMLIDPTMYLLGDRMELQVESSQFPLFQTNQMMWRIVMRFDGQPLLDLPITLADGTFQVSSICTATLT